MIFPAPVTFAAEEVENSTSDGVVIAEISDDNSKQKVLPEAQTNKDTLNYMELVDSFVTAERIPSSRWETPANVYVITSQEIEDNHYQDLAEALNRVPGVIVSSHDNRAVINGNNRILLLMDGQRLDNDGMSFQSIGSDLRFLPSMKMIDRIEIVKGGNSALYGADAVGGVINIITKKGREYESTVDVNYGSWHRTNIEATNSGTKGKLSWFVVGGLQNSGTFNYNDSDREHNTYWDASNHFSDYNDKAFSLRLDDQFTDRNSLTASFIHRNHEYADYFSEHWGYYSWDENPGRDIYNRLSLTYNFKEGTSTPGFFRYTYNKKSSYAPYRFENAADRDNKVHNISYQNGWELGRHKIIAGLEYNRNKAVFDFSAYSNLLDGYTGVSRKDTTYSAYVHDTISLGDKWTFIPGVRFDHSDAVNDKKNNWSPKVALNYKADDATKIYATWGKFYRRPAAIDSERYTAFSSLWYYDEYIRNWYYNVIFDGGWKDIVPETGHTESIGFEHNFDDDTSLALNLFNTKVKNAIYWDYQGYIYQYNGIDKLWNWANGSEKQRGFELTFKKIFNDNFSGDFAYSHVKVDSDYPNQDEGYGLRGVIPVLRTVTPKNSFYLGLHYKNRDVKANLMGTAGSGLSNGLDSYFLLHFNTSYNVSDNAQVYFRVNNITNKKYSTYKYYYEPGRFFQIGLNCTF